MPGAFAAHDSATRERCPIGQILFALTLHLDLVHAGSVGERASRRRVAPKRDRNWVVLQDTRKEERLLGMQAINACHRRPYPEHPIGEFTDTRHVELVSDLPTRCRDDDDRLCRIRWRI